MDHRISVAKEKEKYLIDISDDDVLAAMKEIGGYLDITFADFKELYQVACAHALQRFMQSARAGDIMTTRVISVHTKTSSQKTAEVMATNNVSGVPVVDDNDRVVGIISEKNFLSLMGNTEITSFMSIIARCLENRGCLAVPVRGQKAENIMTSPVITATADMPVAEIVNLFAEKKINRVPVVNQGMELVGIVSRADALQTVIPRIKG